MKKRIFGMLLMGAMVIASMSMFTSCKDYDDDINKNAADITALRTELANLRTQLAGDLSAATSKLEAAIALKANASDLNSKANDSDLTALAARVAALEEKIAAIDNCASKASVEEMATTIATLTGDLTTLQNALASKANSSDLEAYATAAALKAAEENIKTQKDALDLLQQKVVELSRAGYDDTAVKADIKALQDAIKAFAKSSDVETLKTNMQTLSNTIDSKLAGINILNVLVNKILTSVTLIPQLYINGIEAIQFRSIKYQPMTFGPNTTAKAYQWNPGGAGLTFPAYQHNAGADKKADAQPNQQYDVEGHLPIWASTIDHQLVGTVDSKGKAVYVTIDNGETEAYYRLSPAGVKEDEINTAGLEFACTTANTETRAAAITINKPVKPTFSKLENGVMTVKLKKTVTNSLAYNGSVVDPKVGSVTGNIVSLKVPRKKIEATGQEAADIYSEFNLLDEVTITPRIAALNKQADGSYIFNGATATTKHDGTKSMQFHYIDSTHIYQSMVDKDLYVKEVISYKESFDLRKLVTGCYETAAGVHTEITKDELEAYGIKFFFAIPSTVYNTTDNAFNKTDQQVFATLAEDGYTISSKLPSETTGSGSMSVNGKEPIIRVMMVDVNNKNLIDQAYFKIKWADTTPDKEPFKVTESAEQVLSCDGNKMEVNWKQFIEDVYAKLSGSYGDKGLDWDKFRVVYPQTQVYYNEVKAANLFTESADKSHIDYNATGLTTPNGKIRINWLNTEKAPEADANHLTWELDAADIKTIPLTTREKTMTAKVIFKSAQPKDYGNVEMTLNFKIKLPEKPSIVGYNDNQWFVQKEKFYVYPVQYNTLLDGANWTTEVKYDFNVMQQFTVTTETNAAKLKAAGTYTNWIVKGVPMNCGTWDLQFAKSQVNTAYAPKYITSATVAEPLLTEGTPFASFNAYELDKSTKLALNLKWMKDGDAHKSWQNKEAQPFARLTGYKANKDEIIPLMNDLAVENEADGWTPKKTNDDNKSVTMKVWAKYNAYNVEEVTSFKAYLVTPIRIDHKINGAFEDLHISGTIVDAGGKLGITDFAGYAVAKVASGSKGERYKYEAALWKYYGVQDPVFDTKNIIFGVKMEGGNLVVDNSVAVNATGSAVTGGMKMADVATNTAGAFNWSVTVTAGKLTFKNQTGRALDKPFNVFVPVTVKHHFGEAKMFVKIPVYPKGQAIADGYTVIDAE